MNIEQPSSSIDSRKEKESGFDPKDSIPITDNNHRLHASSPDDTAIVTDLEKVKGEYLKEKAKRLACEKELQTVSSLFRLAIGSKDRKKTTSKTWTIPDCPDVVNFGHENLDCVRDFIKTRPIRMTEFEWVDDHGDNHLLEYIKTCRMNLDCSENHNVRCTDPAANALLKFQNGTWNQVKAFPNALWDIVVHDFFKFIDLCKDSLKLGPRNDDFAVWQKRFEAKIMASNYRSAGALTDFLKIVHSELWSFSKTIVCPE